MIRKLVEDARKKEGGTSSIKQAQERTYKFMSAIAGDFVGYEEALRALYKKDEKKFSTQIAEWPHNVRSHLIELAEITFE